MENPETQTTEAAAPEAVQEAEALGWEPDREAADPIQEEPVDTTQEHADKSVNPADPVADQGGKENVPLAALMDERTKRQALEQQLKELTGRFDQVVNGLISGKSKPVDEPQVPELPDYNVDPLGHLKASIAQLAEQMQGLSGSFTKQQETQQVKEADNALTTRWMTDIQSLISTKPDLNDALSFLAESRTAELAEFGLNPQEIVVQIGQEARELAQRSYAEMEKTGKRYNPVEKLYQIALKRGYTAKTNGSVPPLSPKGNPAAVRTFDTPSQTAGPTVTGEAIAKMTEKQFEDFMKDKSWKDIHR